MAVIKTNAWKSGDPDSASNGNPPDTPVPDPQLFGFQDLASDYYQVLIQKERPRACRVIWTVVIMVLFGFTCYMVYQLVYDYCQYNSYNVSSIRWQQNITFPAITICSTNFINYTALKAKLGGDDGGHDLFSDLEDLLYQIKSWSGRGRIIDYLDVEEFWKLKDYEAANGSIPYYFSNEFRDHISSTQYDYMFEEIHMDLGQGEDYRKNVYPTELGRCLELNDDGLMKQTIRGVPGGFTIYLDAHIESYMASTNSKGFVVFIRDQDETVLANQGGYIIAPGMETFMKLQKRSMTRLGTPYGTCENELSKYTKFGDHYKTVRECVQEHKLNLMMKLCRCIPWYLAGRLLTLGETELLNKYVDIVKVLPKYIRSDLSNDKKLNIEERKRRSLFERSNKRRKRSVDSRQAELDQEFHDSNISEYFCDFIVQSLCDSVISQILRQPNSTERMGSCPEPCKYNEWDVEITTTQFPPSKRYFKKYMKLDEWKDPDKFTFEYALSNMIRLHIFYDDIKVTDVKQEKAYEIQNFVAEFGGTVDLFVGFSFFTIFQLIEISIAACFWKYWNYRKPNTIGETVTENMELRRNPL